MQVIGLMSGTSVDGIDAAVVDLSGRELDLQVQLLAAETFPYPPALRQQILNVCAGAALSLSELATLDDAIAQEFARAAQQIQSRQALKVALIGSHGQTVFHRPPAPPQLGYTLQLGRGEVIARQTGIPTVSNFRAADMAAGGQGAPLVSRIDVCLLSHPEKSRCVQNIGGIGNVTFLPVLSDTARLGVGVKGWDTGPGNVLLDLAVQQFSQGELSYDQDGAWAAQGQVCQPLVEQWLQQAFFRFPPPKSTGRELFGPAYLQSCLADAAPFRLEPADVLATLTEFTAAAIAQEYRQHLPHLPDEVVLCGGGANNGFLKQRLQALLAPVSVLTTDELNLSGNAKEAIAFAVLAYWHQLGIPGNLPAVTGANSEVILGTIYQTDSALS